MQRPQLWMIAVIPLTALLVFPACRGSRDTQPQPQPAETPRDIEIPSATRPPAWIHRTPFEPGMWFNGVGRVKIDEPIEDLLPGNKQAAEYTAHRVVVEEVGRVVYLTVLNYLEAASSSSPEAQQQSDAPAQDQQQQPQAQTPEQTPRETDREGAETAPQAAPRAPAQAPTGEQPRRPGREQATPAQQVERIAAQVAGRVMENLRTTRVEEITIEESDGSRWYFSLRRVSFTHVLNVTVAALAELADNVVIDRNRLHQILLDEHKKIIIIE